MNTTCSTAARVGAFATRDAAQRNCISVQRCWGIDTESFSDDKSSWYLCLSKPTQWVPTTNDSHMLERQRVAGCCESSGMFVHLFVPLSACQYGALTRCACLLPQIHARRIQRGQEIQLPYRCANCVQKENSCTTTKLAFLVPYAASRAAVAPQADFVLSANAHPNVQYAPPAGTLMVGQKNA